MIAPNYHGLAELFWKSGGSSLASIGSDGAGRRWYAPTNWITVPGYNWRLVKAIRKIESTLIDDGETDALASHTAAGSLAASAARSE